MTQSVEYFNPQYETVYQNFVVQKDIQVIDFENKKISDETFFDAFSKASLICQTISISCEIQDQMIDLAMTLINENDIPIEAIIMHPLRFNNNHLSDIIYTKEKVANGVRAWYKTEIPIYVSSVMKKDSIYIIGTPNCLGYSKITENPIGKEI